MNALLSIIGFVLCALILVIMPILLPDSFHAFYGDFTIFDSAKALIFCGVLAFLVSSLLSRVKDAGTFLVQLFLAALLVRVFIAAIIFTTNTQDFFGGDAFTYDSLGLSLLKSWTGSLYDADRVTTFAGSGFSGSGWGMVYLVGALYSTIGRNMFATQLLNALLGAVTAPIIFLTAQTLFGHRRVSNLAAFGVAFFPSLILWTSQGLKDGPIIFFLAASILATLKLGERFNLWYFLMLAGALFGLLSMRFYVFYMAVAAIGLGFVVGMRTISAQSVARQLIVVVALGALFAYFGVSRFTSAQIATYGSLEKLENMRKDMATTADSGFGRDLDVSTSQGALSAIPVGMTYLLLAPFPWQMGSLRSAITFPEMLVWWSSFPLMILGVWYSCKYRLRRLFPILVFMSMLTLAYSITQGNVGTAYRQRAQLQVFYLIFVAVGYFLWKEKREDRKSSKLKT